MNQDYTINPISGISRNRFAGSWFGRLVNDTIPLPDEMIETIYHRTGAFNWNDEFQTEDLF
jgi:hypothetical protein